MIEVWQKTGIGNERTLPVIGPIKYSPFRIPAVSAEPRLSSVAELKPTEPTDPKFYWQKLRF